MRKPSFFFSVLVLAAVLLSACAGGSTQAPTEAPAAETQVVTPEPAATEDAAEMPATGGMLPEVDPAEVSGDIITAGSSTVYPLIEAMANRFLEEGYAGNITIDSIGSGAGFERFCVNGETDIANASRAIKDSEIESCRAIGREPIEFRVGTDALVIVVSQENDFVDELSLEEVAKVFSNEVTNWSEINPEWPEEPILRYIPGTDSGTFDFFIEFVMRPVYGEDGEADKRAALEAENLTLNEDDNVLVQGVEGSPYAVGFFGYAYYFENQGSLRAIPVNGIEPGLESAESGEYPLARPLFIYSDAQVMQSKPQAAAFINYFLTYVNEEIEEVGYFPASEDALNEARQKWLDANQE